MCINTYHLKNVSKMILHEKFLRLSFILYHYLPLLHPFFLIHCERRRSIIIITGREDDVALVSWCNPWIRPLVTCSNHYHSLWCTPLFFSASCLASLSPDGIYQPHSVHEHKRRKYLSSQTKSFPSRHNHHHPHALIPWLFLLLHVWYMYEKETTTPSSSLSVPIKRFMSREMRVFLWLKFSGASSWSWFFTKKKGT